MADHDNKSLYEKIKLRQGRLETLRLPYEDVWEEVILFLRPELTKWKDTSSSSKGSKRNLQVYSAAPEEALETWADGMQGNLVSSSTPWFQYLMSQRRFNDIPEVRLWRQESEEVVYSIFRNSNFYQSLGPVFRDAGSIGDAVLWMDKIEDKPGEIDFKTFHPRELYHTKDILHRKFEKTAMEAADFFDKKKLSGTLNNNLRNNPFAMHEFIHACYLKDDIILEGEKDIPDREFISIYIEVNADVDKKEPIRMRGYHTKPYSRWRFSVASDSQYGWGLGCSALVDIYALNETARVNMVASQKAVDPAIMAHKSQRNRLTTKAGGRNWYERPEHAEVKMIQDRLNVPFGVDREERLERAVNQRFNVPFFTMLQNAERQMTATEIIERAGEKSILMGPKNGRMESDLLNTVHERVFSIADDENWIPPPPDILLFESDGRLDIEYIGELAQAQKRLLDTRRSERTMVALAPLIQLKPESIDNMRIDKSFVRIMRDDNWPEEEIASDEEVSEIRRARAEAVAARERLAMMKEAADTVPSLQGKTEAGSPLEQMAGT